MSPADADDAMDCQHVVDLVTDYLEGMLDAATTRRIEGHLAECEGCEIYLDQMRETLRVLGSIPPEQVGPEARSRLLTAFRGWSQQRADST